MKDNWRLQFALADEVGGEWPERVRQAALKIANTVFQVEVDWDDMLMRAMVELFKTEPELASMKLVDHLIKDPSSLWREYKRGQPVAQRHVAYLLRKFGIFPEVVHPTGQSDESPGGYKRDACGPILRNPTMNTAESWVDTRLNMAGGSYARKR